MSGVEIFSRTLSLFSGAICTMSGASDREREAEDALRLVSANMSALLKTSPTARSVFGADRSVQQPVNQNAVTGSSSVNSSTVSLCKSDTVTSVYKMSDACLPETRQVSTADITSESSTNCVSAERLPQERQSATGTFQSTTLSNTAGSSGLLLTQPGVPVKSDDSHVGDDDVCDSLVANEPATTIHTELQCTNLPVTGQPTENVTSSQAAVDSTEPICSSKEVSYEGVEVGKLPEANLQSNHSCSSQTSATNNLTELSRQPTYCCDEIIGAVGSKTIGKETVSGDLLPRKTAVNSNTNVVEYDQPLKLTEAEKDLEPAEKSGEQNTSARSSAVLRSNDTAKSVSRKPSRIVSFTTEDFDLFQRKYVAT